MPPNVSRDMLEEVPRRRALGCIPQVVMGVDDRQLRLQRRLLGQRQPVLGGRRRGRVLPGSIAWLDRLCRRHERSCTFQKATTSNKGFRRILHRLESSKLVH